MKQKIEERVAELGARELSELGRSLRRLLEDPQLKTVTAGELIEAVNVWERRQQEAFDVYLNARRAKGLRV